MSGQPNKRRRTKAIGPDSAEFAKALTHKTITTTNRSGLVQNKNILVPLVPIKPIPSLDNTAGSSKHPSTRQEYEENMDDPILNYNDAQFNTGNLRNKSKVSILILL
jgi:hypothetical protein